MQTGLGVAAPKRDSVAHQRMIVERCVGVDGGCSWCTAAHERHRRGTIADMSDVVMPSPRCTFLLRSGQASPLPDRVSFSRRMNSVSIPQPRCFFLKKVLV
jgi:hypothetical protein